MAEQNDACAVAHGDTAAAPRQTTAQPTSQPSDPGADRALIAVFASSVSGYLLRYAADAGYRCLLVDPDPARASGARMAGFTWPTRCRRTSTGPTWWSPTTTGTSSG